MMLAVTAVEAYNDHRHSSVCNSSHTRDGDRTIHARLPWLARRLIHT